MQIDDHRLSGSGFSVGRRIWNIYSSGKPSEGVPIQSEALKVMQGDSKRYL